VRIVSANSWQGIGFILYLIQIRNPILERNLLLRHFLLLSFNLFWSLEDVVLSRRRFLLLLLALHDLVHVGHLVRIVDLQFTFLRPLLSKCVLANPWDRLM
jgi:hypothetical protein